MGADHTKPTAAEIILDECDYDRKYFLVEVPEFDVDPVDGDGARKMTSYLRLGTTPDDWKSRPGAELELAVHADYGLGGGPDDLPIAKVVPGERLPASPIDPRYVPPTPVNLYKKFRKAVLWACKNAHDLDAVKAWREAEQAQVTEMKSSLGARKAEADKKPDEGFAVSVPVDPDAPDPFPEEVVATDFARFVLEDCESIQATLEERLRGCALGGPTSPLDEREAGEVVDKMRLRGLVELVLRRKPSAEIPWTILAVTPFDAAFEALRTSAAKRAAEKVVETLTDYPDMLLPSGEPKYPPYVDDLRYRGDASDGDEYLPSADRHKNSKHLHTRGGWRDHSDGNRISTTYGDKIEVIRGNYKLMVLGRQDDPGSSNIVDYSGKITQSDDNMLLRVEYTQKDGVWNWEVVNENIIESEVKSGKAYTWWYGVEKIDITGSDSPVTPSASNPMARDGDGLSRGNPHITERTWARSIKEYTGSRSWRVPETYSETWVEKSEEKTDVLYGTIATTTVGGGTIETTTVGGGTIETTTIAGGTVSTTTVGLGTMETSVTGGAAISLTAIGGAQVEITGVAGAIVGMTASAAKVDISAHIVALELKGVGIDLTFALSGLIVDISAHGYKLEGSWGTTHDLNPDKTEINALKTKISANDAFISSLCTNVLSQQTQIATQQTQINTLYNVQSGTVFLG